MRRKETNLEVHRLLVEWNATEAPYPQDKCLHELFEEQAQRSPDATAVVYEDHSLSYAELNAQSNCLAHYLREHGVGPDIRVGICVERGIPMIVGLLGILKAGGAYVPLDPSYPKDRLSYLLSDSEPALVLADASTKELLGQIGTKSVMDLTDSPQWAQRPSENVAVSQVGLTSRHLAYVIYTSGSTGQPKGVMVEHRSLVNYFSWRHDFYKTKATDRFLQKAPFGFDVSVAEIMVPFTAGAMLVVTRPRSEQDADYLSGVIFEKKITAVSFVPSMLKTMFAHWWKCGSVKNVYCGGEAISEDVVREFYEIAGEDCRLHNVYGPTEATVAVSNYLCSWPSPIPGVPIGRPISNVKFYVLGEDGRLVPAGVKGELFIGGACLARGYHNNESLNAEKFIPNPFEKNSSERLYRTGDLVRWLPDGNLEFAGRVDHQVKIRGYRIELGEVESQLDQCAGVKEAVVIAREDVPGDKRLVAYYTGKQQQVQDLREQLQGKLPEYMVPAAYVYLDALPLTPNGKVDRKGLPAPEGEAFSRREYEEPRGEIEQILARIWQELLRVEQVGRYDNFFELGGHSLVAIRVLERMRSVGLRADVRTLYGSPVLKELSAAVNEYEDHIEPPSNLIGQTCEAITPALLTLVRLSQKEIDGIVAWVPGGTSNVQDIYPLAPLQEGILFHYLSAKHGDPYLIWRQRAFVDRGTLDRYIAALNQVVTRHDILRTAIMWEGLSQPVQVVWRHAPVVVEEVILDAQQGDIATQLRDRFSPRHYRLDLRKAPLIKFVVAHDALNQRWIGMHLQQHASGDHVTLEVTHAEIGAIMAGQSAKLPPALPFRNLIAQIKQGVGQEEHELFFKQMLGEVMEPTAPFGLTDVRGDGGGIAESSRMVEVGLAKKICARAKALGVSAASIFHVAWALVTSRTSGQMDSVFGTVLFGRMQGGEGADRVLGPFINTLPIRIGLSGKGVRDSVLQAHRQLGDLLRHEHASLALAQRCSGVPAPTPLFSTLFNYYRHSQLPKMQADQSGAFSGIRLLASEERTNYPITISVDDRGGRFMLGAYTVSTVDPQRLCDMMHCALEGLAEALESTPQAAVSAVDILPAAERHRLLVEWNATEAPYPQDKCLHELFEEQAQRSPDATAVVYEDHSLSYAELNAQSNCLAHYLREHGVGPDIRVGICVERGIPMIVGLLGILKAGGAYVPLDPSYPKDRLSYLLSDSEPALVLADASTKELLGQIGAKSVMDLTDSPQWAQRPSENVAVSQVGLTSRHLAYVIYTSGSTGQPKGVMVEHRSLVNYFSWRHDFYKTKATDRFLQKAPFGFDVSVAEIMVPFTAGAMLVVTRPRSEQDADYLSGVIFEKKITAVSFVPSMLKTMFAHWWKCGSVKNVYCGGEAISEDVVREFYEIAGEDCRLHNVYGPTEATGVVGNYLCSWPSPIPGVPIGRPISNVKFYVLGEDGRLVPAGVKGELFIGGACLARGYHNNESLNAEKFIPNPFEKNSSERLYRTGDLVRWLPDGNLEFAGRVDHQVKIRGYRIELGEVESQLDQCAGVKEAVVIAREDVPGDKRLVAYYTGKQQQVQDLREQLQGKLPEYMVPAAYVYLDALPLTPNGKVDRKGLPAPEGEAFSRREYEEPRGEIEQILARIWQELLRVEQVGRYDNFFELGGHSLLAVQLISRIRTSLNIELPLRDVFEHPSLQDLGRQVRQAGVSDMAAIRRVSRDAPLALSLAQQRLWFLTQLDGEVSRTYHMPISLRLTGALNVAALQFALDRILMRHEGLRTCFVQIEGVTYQKVQPAAGFALRQRDVRGVDRLHQQLSAWLEEEANEAFDLAAGPLIRGQLVRLAEQEYVLQITMHHIVSDGWSMGVFFRELRVLYGAFSQGRPDPLPPLSIQYPDYAIWQREYLQGERLQRQAQYWKETLTGAPALLELPLDHTRPNSQSYQGGSISIELDEQLTASLQKLSHQHQTTLFMTLLTGWAALLSRLSGQDEVVIGTPMANRNRAELEQLIGFFVNTLALRVDLSSNPSTAELLKQVRQKVLAAQMNQDLPFEQVVELLKPQRAFSHTPIFQVMLAWQNLPESSRLELPGVEVTPVEGAPTHTAKFDMGLSLAEVQGRIRGTLTYATSLFQQSSIQRYLSCWKKLLQSMVEEQAAPVRQLEWLPEDQYQQIVVEWNATEAPYPQDKCLHELFEEQAQRSPDATAVVYEDHSLSYAELNAQSNCLAHYLREHGVGPDIRVGICVERGIPMIVGLLGILKAGGAYVPLDPSHPKDRLIYLLNDSNPMLVLSDASTIKLISEIGQRQVLALSDTAQWSKQPSQNLTGSRIGLTSRHLAYVIYTSGSTGRPKGVAIEHHSSVNLLCWAQTSWSDQSVRNTLFSTSLSFDLAVYECFSALTRGATVIVGTKITDIVHVRHDISLINTVPSGVSRLVDSGHIPEGVSCINVAGEPLSRDLIDRIFDTTDTELVCNLYGPTETTTYSSWTTFSREARREVSIGRPISNTQIYILDKHLRPVPIGVAGELYIGGAGVARGYLNLPDLTAERFVTDPFSEASWARMYRTGDLGRWREDGNIEFLGRNDHQVKIRGYRIELGEVESQLDQCAGVKEAVVIAREDVPGDKRLVAYYTGKQQQVQDLREQLQGKLPEYMVPAAYVYLDALPLTPNGKVDRKGLPAPEGEAFSRREYEEPRGEIEQILARIWQELLRVEQVGRYDNFFELGGHSLLAVQLISRIRTSLNIELPLRDVFEHPSLQDLGRQVRQAGVSDMAAIRRVSRDAPLALSLAQQRLWFLTQLDGEVSRTYHMPISLRLTGALNVAALQFALDRILMRHEGLRTCFVQIEGVTYQKVQPAAGFALRQRDVRGVDRLHQQLSAWLEEEANEAFDLAAGPLIRGQLVRLAEQEYVLQITMHHIVSDGWSMGVFFRELRVLYGAFSQGRPDPLPPLSIQYPDYAIWQREYLQGERLQRQAQYWKETLTGAPALLELPLDHTRPNSQSYQGGSISIELDEQLTASLQKLSHQHQTTLFMTLLTGWAALLSRLSGQDEVVIGTPMANRNRAELEQLIGFFVNTLALRVDLSSNPSTAELLKQVRQKVLAAQMNQDLPFEQVVELLKPQRAFSHTPIFQVMLAWQNLPESSRLELPGVEVTSIGMSTRSTQFDLTLSLMEVQGRIRGVLAYATSLFKESSIKRYLACWKMLLQSMLEDQDAPVQQLKWLPEQQYQQVIVDWNRTESPYPQDKCIHELFQEQVEKTAEAMAVIYEYQALTYGELNVQANRLAHSLRERGVNPDVRVGICVERGIPMVVGLLGILKAGGAYVPLDPGYPEDRLRYLLNDSDPMLVLGDTSTKRLLERICQKPVFDLSVAEQWAEYSSANLPTVNMGLRSDHLAYVIYTSGSTGQPKGVMVEHRGVCNLVNWGTNNVKESALNKVLFSTSINFDLAAYECFVPLSAGGSILIVDKVTDLSKSSASCTLINTVPSAMRLLIHDQCISADTVLVNLAGEALSREIVQQLFSLSHIEQVSNLYGPSETTTYSTWCSISREDPLEPSIGRPISNTQIYILDAHMRPVPIGVTGELYIGGAGVARGYLNRPDLTAERFLQDPFSRVAGARMYRTGDLGRWREDGHIEFLGRNDHQVKIRGYRIELGEVESQLGQYDRIRETVVVAREDVPGDRRLVAYYTGEQQEAQSLREHLQGKLPEYMVPTAFVYLDVLPLTPNGKLDRQGLRAPEGGAFGHREYLEPQGEIEQLLAQIWQELLGVERVGRYDNFFELGGHSLLAVQLTARIRTVLGIEHSLWDVFERPILQQMARRT